MKAIRHSYTWEVNGTISININFHNQVQKLVFCRILAHGPHNYEVELDWFWLEVCSFTL